jgi:hypothetical protein
MAFLEEKSPFSGGGLAFQSQWIKCPNCDASLGNWRMFVPRIDECGFESYNLACPECRDQFSGIVDPCDDRLLLTRLQLYDPRCVSMLPDGAPAPEKQAAR